MHRNAKFLEETNKSFRLARDLRLLHDLASPIHNANVREFQRDVHSDIVLHGCPPSPDVWGRLSRDPVSNIYRGTATFTALGAGPITASRFENPRFNLTGTSAESRG